MKTLRILMLVLLLPAFVMTGCTTGGDNPGDAQIVLPNADEKEQQAFADDETTGGFTFTAKQAWTATVTENTTRAGEGLDSATRASGVDWLRLLFGGEETYSGAAGKFTLVIELDENYSGETRTATITIKSGNDTITITVTQDGKKEDGTVPVEPGKPVPDGMRYVSRIVFRDSYTGNDQTISFDYDSKNRVIGTTTTGPDSDGAYDSTLSYDDAARTVTMVLYDEDDDDRENHTLQLNADGAIVSGESLYGETDLCTAKATYTNGYLDKFTFTDKGLGPNSDEIFTMTWIGGDMRRMVYYDEDDGHTSTDNLTYNTSWANNPLCNLDLNTLIYSFDDGVYEGFAELLGLFGKRSKNMVSGVVYGTDYGTLESKFTVEYDTDGFVTKITGDDSDVYTIIYR